MPQPHPGEHLTSAMFADKDVPAEASVVAALAMQAGTPQEVPGSDDLVVVNGTVVDLRPYAEQPDRIKASRQFDDTDSLGRYIAAHNTGRSTVYVDGDALIVRALLDDHRVVDSEQDPSWRTHEAMLIWQHSEEWRAWLQLDQTLVEQETLAEHLEAHDGDVLDPPGAALLEIVGSIRASEAGEFRQVTRLPDGSGQFSYTKDVTAGAGPSGELTIPTAIKIGIPVFDHQEVAHEMTARFRWRLHGGSLKLGYLLDRPDLAKREAIQAEVDRLQKLVGDDVPVYRGRP